MENNSKLLNSSEHSNHIFVTCTTMVNMQEQTMLNSKKKTAIFVSKKRGEELIQTNHISYSIIISNEDLILKFILTCVKH